MKKQFWKLHQEPHRKDFRYSGALPLAGNTIQLICLLATG